MRNIDADELKKVIEDECDGYMLTVCLEPSEVIRMIDSVPTIEPYVNIGLINNELKKEKERLLNLDVRKLSEREIVIAESRIDTLSEVICTIENRMNEVSLFENK